MGVSRRHTVDRQRDAEGPLQRWMGPPCGESVTDGHDGAMSHGVSFVVGPGGDRSTTSTGRGVVADALGAVDPVGARSVEHETAWRSRYLHHFRRLVEAGLGTPEAWWSIADAGLVAVHERMVVLDDADAELPMSTLLGAPSKRALTTVEVKGHGRPAQELLLPHHGQFLRGAELREQLLAWDRLGVLEPSAVDAVMDVVDYPEWLRLDGHTAVVLGAGAEMGRSDRCSGAVLRLRPLTCRGPAFGSVCCGGLARQPGRCWCPPARPVRESWRRSPGPIC